MKILALPTQAIITVVAALMIISAPAAAQEKPDTPPGYIVVTGWYKDNGIYAEYGRAVGPVLRDYGFEGAKFGLEGDNLTVIEGDWVPGRVLLIKFTSGDHVKRFWWSEAYEEAKKIRMPISAVDIAHVNGVPGITPLMNDDSAYLVFLAEIKDRATLMKDYVPFAPALVTKHGGQFIISAGRANMELLEGDIPNASLVIVEFPDVDSMKAFWADPEYQRLSDIRKATGKWSVAEIVPQGPQ